MTTTNASGATGTTGPYITTVSANAMFADPTYQRPLDDKRVAQMTEHWSPRLVGIIEVCDRGEHALDRYAIIDGQHRWAAAAHRDLDTPLVVNVHEHLTIADEALLFDKLNRLRRAPTTWDHYRARRTAGDPQILAIEATTANRGLQVSESVADGNIWCISTLEKIANTIDGLDLLDATLALLTTIWGTDKTAFEAPRVHGTAILIHTFGENLDADRYLTALEPIPARRIRFAAQAARDHIPGSLSKLTALTLLEHYNRAPGRKLLTPPRWTGVLPKAPATQTVETP